MMNRFNHVCHEPRILNFEKSVYGKMPTAQKY